MVTTTATRIGSALLGSKALAALASPHTVDSYLMQINPMWAAREVRARIVDITRETEGVDTPPVATITLQPTSTWAGHRAGQHVQVGVDLPGSADPKGAAPKRLTRVFTISSAASAPGERITLTLRANPDGQVSRYLVEEARPGQIVHLSQALGEFTLTESPATPTNNRMLLITGGSGITPAMSMVRTLLRDGYDGRAGRPVTFLHFAQGPADQIFADELAEIAAADNDVDVHLMHAASGDPLFSEFHLRRLVPDFRDVDTWACGPAGLVELIQEAFTDSDRLRVEYFKAPVRRSADADAEGTVAFATSDVAGANTGASLLEQAEALGLKPEFGCRMGICFSCTAVKKEGAVRNVLTDEVSDAPDEEIRICVSTPEGDCTVDL